MPDAHTWYVARRWLQFEGELRTNLLRTIAICVFYSIHLANYGSSQGWFERAGLLQLEGNVDRAFHCR